MCLQYAIWTAAASGHPKYGRYHDALYRRARQYLEADELKVSQGRRAAILTALTFFFFFRDMGSISSPSATLKLGLCWQ